MTGLQRLRAFAKSPHHLWCAVLTLGLGLASAHPLGIAAGAAAYALAWIYLPDTGFFRRWLAKREAAGPEATEAKERARELRQARESLFASLAPPRQGRYRALAEVAASIESHLRSQPRANQLLAPEFQMQPVDSLMATFLRLLHTEQVLETFLHGESEDDLTPEVDELRAEVGGDAASAGPTDPLAQSRRAKLATLEKRLERTREAASKLMLTRAEQERVTELVKLARADLVTASDPATLRHRIDSGARQVSDASAWTGSWDDGTDIDPAFDLTPGDRIGFDFGTATADRQPPPVPVAE